MRRRGGTFGIPAILAAATLIALVVGLLGDGMIDLVAWIGVGLPLIAICIALTGRPARRAEGSGKKRASGRRQG